MNIVFIHHNFPGRFGFLAQEAGRHKDNKTIFISSQKNSNKVMKIPGVQKIFFSEKISEEKKNARQPAISPGLSVANVLSGLKKEGFKPDLIIGHSGAGTSFYVKDVFPDIPFLGFFEWFHRPDKIQDDFKSKAGPDLKVRMNLRNRNLSILSDLCACDSGICPTDWQKSQFPKEFHEKLSIIHDGIDTDFFQPIKNPKFKTDSVDLTEAKQLITYTANVLAPYMGFQQFIESLPAVLEQKPDAHVAIVGADRISFKDESGNKKSYKSVILEKINLDQKKVHFIDGLTQENYKSLLQASCVHVYLDSPLVLSKSLLEAMACECLVIAPDIPPVREVIKDGTNGIIVDFSSLAKITEKIVACLDFPSFMKAVKQKARQTIVNKYAIDKVLLQQLYIMKTLINQDKQLKQFG
jgi:glycosyltransferase involved in cell wall biosynthesis